MFRRRFLLLPSRFVISGPVRLGAVAVLAVALLAGCSGREESPVQADQGVLEGTVGAGASDGVGTGAGGLTGDQGNDSPAVNGDDNLAGDEDEGDDGSLTAEDVGVQIEPTVVDAVLGENVTVTGILATRLSDEVITLEGVTLAEQPAEELLIIIPTSIPTDQEALDEGSLVAVTGEVFQMTDERLAEVDPTVFEEHGEFLEGFRSAWGIIAADVSVAEEGEE